jgi:fumarate hydratase class II
MQEVLEKKSKDFSSMPTLGQTYLQDAFPTTLDQNFAGYTDQIAMNIERLKTCQSSLYQLPMNYLAGTQGIDVPEGFTKDVAQSLKGLTGFPFIHAAHQFEELHTYNAMIELSGTLNALAVTLSE